MPTGFANLAPQEVKARLDAGDDILLLDVREPQEYATAHIEGSELKPLSQANDWARDLPHDRPIIVFCHHGGRSAQVAQALTEQLGHTNVANMTGGIEQWSLDIDPTIPRY